MTFTVYVPLITFDRVRTLKTAMTEARWHAQRTRNRVEVRDSRRVLRASW